LFQQVIKVILLADRMHLDRTQIFGFVLWGLAFVYIVVRAGLLSFTYDECWSFMGYAEQSVWSTVTNETPAANNHILHSLLMKVAFSLFGMSELALRLPVLLGFVVFGWFSWNVAKEFQGMQLLVFAGLVLQPYLLDYFVLARGYGLALAFMMGALLFAYRYSQSKVSSHALWALVFAAAASYTNFTYLLLYISIGMMLVFFGWRNAGVKRLIPILLTVSVFLVMLVAYPISRLIEAQELYYGGTVGFYTDTLKTLGHVASYKLMGGGALAALFALVLLYSGAHVLYLIWRKKSLSMGVVAASVLVLIALGSVMQHYIIGSKFLIDRTAMVLLPLFVLAAFHLIQSHIKRPKLAAGLLVSACAVNMALAANLTHTIDFKEHADYKAAFYEISEVAEKDTDPFRLGKSVYMNAPIGYYRRRMDMLYVQKAGLEFCDGAGPVRFYYLFGKDVSCVEGKPVELIAHYPVSDTYLYQTIE